MGKQRKHNDRFATREAEKYEHPIPSREFILDFLAERGRPVTQRQLLIELELDGAQEKEAIRRRLAAMVRDGQLIQNRRGAYGLLEKMDLVPGRVVGHKDGYGFLIPDDNSGDLFINAREMRKAFHDDKVLARVSGIDHRGRREAAIVEVTEHNTHEIVGRLLAESGSLFVQPTNSRIAQDILIPPDGAGGAKPGQMVVVEMTTQPDATTRPLGRIKEIMGDHMAPGMEIDVAIRNHELPHVWPEDVLLEAARFKTDVSPDTIQNRLDLRDLPFVTIDGEDAKDFDDAVYCKPGKNGFTLYVAIADVSHYVRPHSALDKEAYNRGNSVYFPGEVIPMLPEVLSNGLCSLNPKVDRLALVCEMEINGQGKITHADFHEAVFRSKARLTYNQVNAMVVEKDERLQQQFSEVLPHVKALFTLYDLLHKTRKKRGSIDFDLPETKIIFGENRKIERIVALSRNDAHRLIEECMLCANISAARFLLKHECPGLFRVHEGPSPEKLMDLRKFLSELGLKLPGKEQPTPRDYASLLETVAGRPDAHVIQTVLLRSLSQAIYHPENKGHFGLAFDAYTHFTSPIRRYPDLLVHRAIRHILQKKHVPGEDEPIYEKYGEHCSMTERRADEATREAVNWLKCEYMLDKVGEEFDGVISSVTSFGLFIELTDIYVEGLIHISLLPNDYYHFDPLRHEIHGERSGTRYHLGKTLKVKVVRVDLDECKIDFMLAESLRVKSAKPHQRPQKKKSRKRKFKKPT
ncbi:MAG TPA: ribonuclease R [Gammaproteobacteria bacterium]|nr:ribonuclease R [Gammaproteobacteria bacterium]